MPAVNDDLRLELMTSAEVAQALAEGIRTIVIPCGAIEQHGPHLSLSVDADHADHLGILVARGLGNSLVAPTIKVGCSSHHLPFAGTISLRNATFEMICRDYCTSLASHGFERILIFSAHVGNCPPLADMLPRLRAAVPASCRVAAFTDARAWLENWRDAVTQAGGETDHVGGHADIAETSLMLDIHPDRVRPAHYEAGPLGLPSTADLDLMWEKGLRALSPNGILGDPHGSSIAIGRNCIERMTALLVDSFRRDAF
ncbi:creatininase [Sphingomonas sp. Root710]|uniref:creatininase family protein n=1 Tax=Sphingomonas sp. Root710 TaxID=1736594 RepID=UPI000701489D|nr:creatininase family protein [Sphingomonas sp. Root710]KRB85293.1 creatininase [Sphingomonas sp. Root710]